MALWNVSAERPQRLEAAWTTNRPEAVEVAMQPTLEQRPLTPVVCIHAKRVGSVWPDGIVMATQFSIMICALQQFISEAGIKSLDVTILHGLLGAMYAVFEPTAGIQVCTASAR